jgi:hypothetical protein
VRGKILRILQSTVGGTIECRGLNARVISHTGTYHRFSFLVKLVNFAFRLKYLGITSFEKRFLSRMTKPLP